MEVDTSVYNKLIKENRLSGNEIKELLFNKKLSGKLRQGKLKWTYSLSDEGECEYTRIYVVKDKTRKVTAKGKCWVKGDELWFQFESIYGGLEYYAEIYKNPEGNKSELSEYFYLTDFLLCPFSIME